MLKKLFLLIIAVIVVSFSACTNLDSGKSNENPLAQAIAEGGRLVASAVTGVNDGDYYPEDIQAVNIQLNAAKSIYDDPSATGSKVD